MTKILITDDNESTAQDLLKLENADADPNNGRASLESLVETRIREFVEKLGRTIDSETGLHDLFMRQVERPLIKVVLEAVGGNQLRAAHILGINRNTLRKKIINLAITPAKPGRKEKPK